MDELIKLLNVFVELKCFIVQVQNEIEAMPGYYLFTITPMSGTEFNTDLYKLLSQSIPSDISCSKSRMSIKFSASPVDQNKLLDAFFEVLRLYMVEDRFLYTLLAPYAEEQPFVRLLKKYKKVEVKAKTETKLVDEDAKNTRLIHPTPTLPATEPAVEAPAPPPLPTLKQNTASFYATTSGIVKGQPPEPSEEERLTWGLQSDLGKIIKLMDACTELPKVKHMLDFLGATKSVTQSLKNVMNASVGDADAAINVKEKLRPYAKIVGRHFNFQEIGEIISLITSRLLHVQQNHLKDSHQVEITTLTSAFDRAKKIRTYLDAKGTIPQLVSAAL